MKLLNNIISYFNLTLLFACTIVLVMSCKNSKYPIAKANKDRESPGKVSNIKVENIDGGAIIHYTLPDAQNLFYVEAVYITKYGDIKREKKRSYYDNQIMVNGFADTSAHIVKLYTVSRGRKPVKSQPESVTIHPLEAPFNRVFHSIKVISAFGGAKFTYKNPDTASIAISVFAQDSTGKLVLETPSLRKHTDLRSGNFYVRGLKPTSQKIGYSVYDKFNNYSDTIFVNIKPLYSVKLDKSKWSIADFPFDWGYGTRGGYPGWPLKGLWDNKGYPPGSHCWATTGGKSKFPFFWTIDLGQKAKISRVVLYGRSGSVFFSRMWPLKFQIYGSSNPNLTDGVPLDSSWTLLGTFTVHLPPGYTEATSALINTPYPDDNVSFTIPNAAKNSAFRYFRYRELKTWSGSHRGELCEMDIYGQPTIVEGGAK
jgi:hypothetical protein